MHAAAKPKAYCDARQRHEICTVVGEFAGKGTLD
jgi:hypothetical protein